MEDSLVNVIETPRDGKQRLKFCEGATRDAGKMHEFSGRTPSGAFRKIRGDGHGRAANLTY